MNKDLCHLVRTRLAVLRRNSRVADAAVAGGLWRRCGGEVHKRGSLQGHRQISSYPIWAPEEQDWPLSGRPERVFYTEWSYTPGRPFTPGVTPAVPSRAGNLCLPLLGPGQGRVPPGGAAPLHIIHPLLVRVPSASHLLAALVARRATALLLSQQRPRPESRPHGAVAVVLRGLRWKRQSGDRHLLRSSLPLLRRLPC